MIAPKDSGLIAVNIEGFEGPAISFAELATTPVTGAVHEAQRAVTPDTIAKLLFTSGSTGMPKG